LGRLYGRWIIISAIKTNSTHDSRSGYKMLDGSLYKAIELVGTSPKSWEEAVQNVVAMASKTLRDTRIAEVKELDVRLENGKIVDYRAKVRLSFKYEKEED
jgi:flavin-binding protein dodecin